MADVFISYHEKSAGELAAQIADALESAGISCWYAKRDIPPGGDFARYIPPQIDACKVFLLILNDSVVHHSNHIENELGLAFGRFNNGEKITILPLEIGDFKRESWIRYYLVHTQSLKIPLLDYTHIQELVEQISKVITFKPIRHSKLLYGQQLQVKLIDSGKCGNTVNYTIDEHGLLTIFGVGDMWNYDYKSNKTKPTSWLNHCSNIRINSDVTSIGNYAFNFLKNLNSVIISDSVTSIGDMAFTCCYKLQTITIPDSITHIGKRALAGCLNLLNVSIPENLTIDKNTFPHTTSIQRRHKGYWTFVQL